MHCPLARLWHSVINKDSAPLRNLLPRSAWEESTFINIWHDSNKTSAHQLSISVPCTKQSIQFFTRILRWHTADFKSDIGTRNYQIPSFLPELTFPDISSCRNSQKILEGSVRQEAAFGHVARVQSIQHEQVRFLSGTTCITSVPRRKDSPPQQQKSTPNTADISIQHQGKKYVCKQW